jgi:hypothetical protein
MSHTVPESHHIQQLSQDGLGMVAGYIVSSTPI